jgi:short-subunit dehydrogenase
MPKLALITGASAGLGVDFARELASFGHNLILTARRLDRLDALKQGLEKKHGIVVHCISSDLSSEEGCQKLLDLLRTKGLSPDILINNAGYGACGAFDQLPSESQMGMISLNVLALCWLTRQLLPDMLKRKQGYILNVASVAAFQPGPGMATYFATKAFVLSFSEALHEEVLEHGVHVSCLCPGTTRTEFFEVAGADHVPSAPGTMESLPVVRAGLNGMWGNQAVVVPGWHNFLTVQLNRFLPRFVVRKAAKMIVLKRFLMQSNLS